MIVKILKILGLGIFGSCLVFNIFFFASTRIRCIKINKQQTIGNEFIQKIKSLKNEDGEYPHLVEQLATQIPGVTVNIDPAGTLRYKDKFFVYMTTEDHKNFDLSFPALGIDFATYSTGNNTWFGTCR